MKTKIHIRQSKTNSAATYVYSNKVTQALKQIIPGLQAAFIENDKEESNYFNSSKELDLCGVDVVLEFNNGALIKYWSSEWGGLTKVEKDQNK